ncbi:MAG: nuclear transport factor 2 family protein [Erythrobacter sp.]|nr:nuclear transport factor 2 family protein [Erythrobacter sp.]MDZ4273625.1 nuclear transport factor 2 family protein [Erythrobacter sp.]
MYDAPSIRNAHELSDIVSILLTYFDGLYKADSHVLRSVFHPRAIYVSAASGELIYRNMEEYFAIVDQRISPEVRGEMRLDRIRSIDLIGPQTAFATANCAIGESKFTDILNLVRLDGRWWIIAKLFHVDPLQGSSSQTRAI